MDVQHMKKLLCRILALGVIGIMITTNVYASDFSSNREASEITQYMDCFMPMPIIGNLSDDCWGAAEVGPRDQDNGLEDRTITKSKTVSVTKLLKKNQTTVKIPEKVTYKGVKYNVSSIDKKVFFNNKKIRKVVIGKNITTIGAGNFLNCTNLKSITFKGKRAPKIGTRSFLKINKKCKINISKKMKGKQLKVLKKRIKKANLLIN